MPFLLSEISIINLKIVQLFCSSQSRWCMTLLTDLFIVLNTLYTVRMAKLLMEIIFADFGYFNTVTF